jgi:hypothetical protein
MEGTDSQAERSSRMTVAEAQGQFRAFDPPPHQLEGLPREVGVLSTSDRCAFEVHTRGKMSHQHVRVLSIPVILLTLVCLGIFVSPLLVYFSNPSHPDSAVFVGTAAVWLFAAAMVMALTLVVARFLKPRFAIALAVVILATLPAALLLLFYRAGPAHLASVGIQQFVTLVGVSLLPPTILGWLIGHRLRLRRIVAEEGE